MPIIKYIPIHQYPIKLLEYVMRGDKTDECKFVTGMNCTANEVSCFDEMKSVFETCTGERFYKRSLDYKDDEQRMKESVRLHHYIQSFSPGETTPEQAHKIGLEWAEKVFGKNHQVLVSTHVDRGHIHTHFVVSAFDLEGKRWISNKKTLEHCRKVSDQIAKEHGLSIIEQPKSKGIHYAEWLARQTKTSWKTKLCDDIDRLILQENVNSLADLAHELRQKGYSVNLSKYMSVKANARCRRGIRTRSLGDGYSVEELVYRIKYKNLEYSSFSMESKSEEAQKYALLLRELQIIKFRNPETTTIRYSDLIKSSELLEYLSENKITSTDDFADRVNFADENYKSLRNKKADIIKKLELEEKIAADSFRYLELKNKASLANSDIKEMKALKYLYDYKIETEDDVELHKNNADELKKQLAEIEHEVEESARIRKSISEKYELYISQMKSDYDIILEKLKREKEEAEREAENSEKYNRHENIR